MSSFGGRWSCKLLACSSGFVHGLRLPNSFPECCRCRNFWANPSTEEIVLGLSSRQERRKRREARLKDRCKGHLYGANSCSCGTLIGVEAPPNTTRSVPIDANNRKVVRPDFSSTATINTNITTTAIVTRKGNCYDSKRNSHYYLVSLFLPRRRSMNRATGTPRMRRKLSLRQAL